MRWDTKLSIVAWGTKRSTDNVSGTSLSSLNFFILTVAIVILITELHSPFIHTFISSKIYFKMLYITYNMLKIITILNLVNICYYTQILHNYQPYFPHCKFHTGDLFCKWKFAPLNLPHLFLSSPQSCLQSTFDFYKYRWCYGYLIPYCILSI